MIEPFTFVAPTASADGYGASAEHLALAAVRAHRAPLSLVPYDWKDDRFADPAFARLQVPESTMRDRRISVVYFLPYALARFKAEVTLSMTMFETDRMPDKWAALVEAFADGMIVPSDHCRDVFSQRVSVPIEVAPFGTDISFHRYVERSLDRKPWVFAMSGILHYRKGVEFALRAFREEFANGEDVQLWLKTRRGFLDVGAEGRTLEDPRVRVIDEDYERHEMRNLYESADVFVATSRGEGSGLTPRDAMATGLPVIATDWSGLTEIADPRYGWPIEVEDFAPAPVNCTSYGAGVTGGGDIGNFARPSVAAIRAAMRESFEDREGARARGATAARWMRERWSWERCAGDWLDSIERLAGVRG